MTSHNEWFFGLRNQLRGLRKQMSRRQLVVLTISLQGFFRSDRSSRTIVSLGKQHIFGNIDQNRAGTTATRNVKRLMHDISQFFDTTHQKIVLGDWLSDTN